MFWLTNFQQILEFQPAKGKKIKVTALHCGWILFVRMLQTKRRHRIVSCSFPREEPDDKSSHSQVNLGMDRMIYSNHDHFITRSIME